MKPVHNLAGLKASLKGNKGKEGETLPPSLITKVIADESRFKEVEKKEEKEVELFTFKQEKVELKMTGDIYEQVFEAINYITDNIYDKDPRQKTYVANIAEIRGLNPEVLINNKCFYVPSPEYIENLFSELPLWREEYAVATSTNTLWKTRFIIPLRDFHNKVYGFVGWDKYSNAKYVEYMSPLYRKASIKAIGLNNVKDIINANYLILTEGSFDYFRGKQHNLSILANLGVSFNKRLKPLLGKVPVIFTAYDGDETGIKNMNTIDKLHPNVYNIIFNDVEKVNDEGNTYMSKGDLDDVLKDLKNVERLKREIDIRVNNPNIRMSNIII